MGAPGSYPISRNQAISNIIDSVAKEQAALANILEAEGDKLKKLVFMPCVCPEVLLAANKSVEKTVKAIARLETVLQSKLELFDDCLCPCPCPSSGAQTCVE